MGGRRFGRWAAVAAVVVSGAVMAGVAPSGAAPPVAAARAPAEVLPGRNGRIAFQSNRDGDDEIYSVAADGTDLVQLTTNTAADQGPVWSPDGTRIAFTSNRSGTHDIWVMGADGSNPTRLTTASTSELLPTWSPDGTRLAYVVDEGAGAQKVWVMDADGTDLLNLSGEGSIVDTTPAWSPDGTEIAFSRFNTLMSSYDLWTMDADGGNAVSLTLTPEHEVMPAWSPDGSTLAFASLAAVSADYDLSAMPSGGGAAWLLTPGTSTTSEARPAWSPDGTRIVYGEGPTSSGPFDLWTMGADGTDPTPLIEGTGNDQNPDWQWTPALGSITVTQYSQPGSGQDFPYTVTGAGLTPFSLDDDLTATLPASRQFHGLAAGTYTVTQSAVAGWTLTGLDCDAATVSLAQRRATITLGAGVDASCTFTDVWRRPDGAVATSAAGPFKGAGVYATAVTAAQTRSVAVARGATTTIFVQVRNDGGAGDAFRVRGATSGSSGYTVRYKVGAEDVTAAVEAGTYRTRALVPGEAMLVKVKVTATRTAAVGSARNVDLTVRSVAITSQRDVVRARAVRS